MTNEINSEALPAEAHGLQLYRINAREELLACEAVMFLGGKPAVEVTLRRAALSGRVEIGAELGDHFADVLDANGNMVENVALDARSYGILKNKWMRCKLEACA